MTEGTKQAYLDKMTAQLKVWSTKMDVIKAQIEKESASERIKLHTQLEKWNEKELLFKQKIEDVRAAGVDGFEKMKLAAQATWNELNTFMKTNGDKKNDIQ
jgi:hypothetical protein